MEQNRDIVLLGTNSAEERSRASPVWDLSSDAYLEHRGKGRHGIDVVPASDDLFVGTGDMKFDSLRCI